MTQSRLQLRNISFRGPNKIAASLDFKAGVNVVCGASETGKSFIVEAIDFLLGGVSLRDIPERVGYGRARISLQTYDQQYFTFERNIEGGGFLQYEGLLSDNVPKSGGISLNAKHLHGKTDNFSGWLLSKTGIFEKLIRRNQQGETKSLSFRDFARLIIVQENEIVKQGSPFLTGQYVTKTAEYSALKLFLTGVDDSGLISETEAPSDQKDVAGKLELIEQWLIELRAEVDEIDSAPYELGTQLQRLEIAIDDQRSTLQQFEQTLEEAIFTRRETQKERENTESRIDEVHDLIIRFNLLRKHYHVDIERLSAIEESGSLFVHQEKVACPLCGASPEDQHLSEKCEGDIETTVLAARAEVKKINRLSSELEQTVIDLKNESDSLTSALAELNERYAHFDKKIRESISPNLSTTRAVFSDLVEKRSEIKQISDIFNRIGQLEIQRRSFVENLDEKESRANVLTDLSKSVQHEFSKKVEKILDAWNFPSAKDIYFDETASDFVINGKPRGSQGKGLRAITHAAATIGLLEFCKEKSLPHPGFIVLDSPLLAYWAPEGEEDNLKGTDLKDRFYAYLTARHQDSQIIIIENEHPPEAFIQDINLTVFTKNPLEGRYGFFPE